MLFPIFNPFFSLLKYIYGISMTLATPKNVTEIYQSIYSILIFFCHGVENNC